jgi:hypothetical protein
VKKPDEIALMKALIAAGPDSDFWKIADALGMHVRRAISLVTKWERHDSVDAVVPRPDATTLAQLQRWVDEAEGKKAPPPCVECESRPREPGSKLCAVCEVYAADPAYNPVPNQAAMFDEDSPEVQAAIDAITDRETDPDDVTRAENDYERALFRERG